MKLEIRADGKMIIEGYVNAVGRDSNPLPQARGTFIEQVVPGTFRRALEKSPDVELMHNHRRVIGSVAQKTLSLKEDSIGLFAHAEIADDTVKEKARKGELRGWSFGFKKPSDEWDDSGQIPRRKLNDFELEEVSIIDSDMKPCYAGTSIEARGEGTYEYRAVYDDWTVTDNEVQTQQDESGNTPTYENERRSLEILKLKGVIHNES